MDVLYCHPRNTQIKMRNYFKDLFQLWSLLLNKDHIGKGPLVPSCYNSSIFSANKSTCPYRATKTNCRGVFVAFIDYDFEAR